MEKEELGLRAHKVSQKFGRLLLSVSGIVTVAVGGGKILIYVDKDSTLATNYKEVIPEALDGVEVVVKLDTKPSALILGPLTP